jgi:23S rRNA maturation-related 3'-5' exoribonuclease YhaM
LDIQISINVADKFFENRLKWAQNFTDQSILFATRKIFDFTQRKFYRKSAKSKAKHQESSELDQHILTSKNSKKPESPKTPQAPPCIT